MIDAWPATDHVGCAECGLEGCEDHIPDATDRHRLLSFTLADLQRHRFPARRTLLRRAGSPLLRQGDLAQVIASRGDGKTWFVQTLSVIAATGGAAMGFEAPHPCRVLHIDGEMASEELQERFAKVCSDMQVSAPDTLTVVAADWQDTFLPRFDTDAGQIALEPLIDQADLVILDNRSCLCDPEGEKDATAWQATQGALLSLRRRGKAAVIAHHANRQGGARGHSKPEDVLNLIIKLARPDDYQADQGARFIATFEKSRGVHGAAVAPFEARLTTEGWMVDSHQAGGSTTAKLLEHVRLSEHAGQRLTSANAAIRSACVQRAAGLSAWAELLKSGAIAKHPEGGFSAA